jgi:hypothetical protein
MARQFTGPLTAEDIAYLSGRHPAAYVDRMVSLLGTEDAPSEAPAENEEGGESGDEGGEQGQTQPEGSEAGEDSDPDTGDEDLIGATSETSYDPLAYTTKEVRAHLKTVTAEEAERIKAVEAAREDREPRTSITQFDPS